MFSDLLTVYMNDKNSSALREFLSVTIAGYEHSDSKIGYNGYKHLTAGKPISCEAKPHNLSSDAFEDFKKGNRKTSPHKLNGSGSFNDYTPERFKRDLQEKLNMLVSGFVDGRLIFLLEFPFNDNTFKENLQKQLNKRFPDGRPTGQYLRGASFNFSHYINSKNLKLVYCDMLVLKEHKGFIAPSFYKRLVELTEQKENRK